MSFRGRGHGNRPFSSSSLPRTPNRTPGWTPAPSYPFSNQPAEESFTMSSNVGNDHRTTSEEGESLTSLDLGIDGGSILTAVSQI